MNKLRISSKINLHYCPMDDVSEFIRQGLSFHKKMGFDAADFPMNLLDLMGKGWEKGVITAAEDAVKAGIRFEICHLPFGIKSNAEQEEISRFNARMYRAIDAAKILGVDYAVLHPNTSTVPLESFDRQAQYDSVMSHLSPYTEYAAKTGVNIVIENMRVVHSQIPIHRYCGAPDELCDIADALGIGICWDFGHANINGLKQSEAFSYIGSRLKVLHVNDNFGNGDCHVAPFCGQIDWRDAMQGIGAIGFQGLLNYEVATHHMPAAVRESFARYLLDAAHELIAYGTGERS